MAWIRPTGTTPLDGTVVQSVHGHGSTVDPITTNTSATSPDDVPELTATFTLLNWEKNRVRVRAYIDGEHNQAAGRVNLQLREVVAGVGEFEIAGSRSSARPGIANGPLHLKAEAELAPGHFAGPGPHTVKASWWVSSGTGKGVAKNRGLTFEEVAP